MIKGHCVTYLDDYQREEWPGVFAAVPVIGHHVRSMSSHRSLCVCAIEHYIEEGKPMIRVELRKAWDGIK